jgi:hypothetical protein
VLGALRALRAFVVNTATISTSTREAQPETGSR